MNPLTHLTERQVVPVLILGSHEVSLLLFFVRDPDGSFEFKHKKASWVTYLTLVLVLGVLYMLDDKAVNTCNGA